jgi:SAM-dependent methyltransferase
MMRNIRIILVRGNAAETEEHAVNKDGDSGVIQRAKDSFSRSLFASDYHRIHSDGDQLRTIVELCSPLAGKSCLDLGTGNGYVAFALSDADPDARVVGVDIVEQAIRANTERAEKEARNNMSFASFDGAALPFKDASFHGVVSRYAFHHFPLASGTVAEIRRILEPRGFCVIVDPVADVQDSTDFANSFAGLRDDGHVRFYTEDELCGLFREAGFSADSRLHGSVSIPRDFNEEYARLLRDAPQDALELYRVATPPGKVQITMEVLIARFLKEGS